MIFYDKFFFIRSLLLFIISYNSKKLYFKIMKNIPLQLRNRKQSINIVLQHIEDIVLNQHCDFAKYIGVVNLI